MTKINKDKYYVVTPLKESSFDENDFKLVGTQNDIAEYIREQVTDSYLNKELDFEMPYKTTLYHVDFHCGSSDGKSGVGSSTVCKTYKDARVWMNKELKESQFEAPNTIIFKLTPVYWVTKSYLKRKKEMNKLLNRE